MSEVRLKIKNVVITAIATVMIVSFLLLLCGQLPAGRDRESGPAAAAKRENTESLTALSKIGCPAASPQPTQDSRSPLLDGEADWLDNLIEKICFVESSGRADCGDGDGGRAAGPMQIHPCVVDDVNLNCWANYTYEDRRDPEKARQIARLYITLWMERNREEIAARIWNGGPRGWAKKATKEYYWERVREVRSFEN